jgi:hypothetical protein
VFHQRPHAAADRDLSEIPELMDLGFEIFQFLVESTPNRTHQPNLPVT